MSSEELVRFAPGRTLTPVMNLQLAKTRLEEFRKFVAEYMVKDEDYGQIPGTPKPTLYKPGADKLCELYGLSDSYRVIDRIVDFDRGLFDYEIECTLSRDGQVIATGLGSCSSYEGKYRWRDSKYKCPTCGKETIIKGKEEYGGGWLCFQKKGGCNAKFDADDPRIVGQTMGQVENEDIATLKNTILKMAKKRAKVDATLAATRSSGVFTQDQNDPEGTPNKPPVNMPKRASDSQPPHPADQPQSNGQPSQPANGLITPGQVKRLWAIGYDEKQPRGKLTKDRIVEIVASFGYRSVSDIRHVDYDRIISSIEKNQTVQDDGDPGPQSEH